MEGDSVRELKRLNPFDKETGQNPVPISYRYEYQFEVYDTSGAYVDTISVANLDEFVDTIPVAIQLGGLEAPTSAEVEPFATDAASNWVSPQTHWMMYH
ncbi:MAG: hypothetical protein JJ916_04705 [Phycisphaerales bacterium]|nr:hypothetical protein [Phycisphaerales bacterium]